MWKLFVTGVAAFLLAASQLAHAQYGTTSAGAPQLLSDADLQALTDRRIEVLKFALGLTPAGKILARGRGGDSHQGDRTASTAGKLGSTGQRTT